MTQGCLISLPGAAIFTTTKNSLLNPSLLAVSSKPIKPHRFSCSLKLPSPSSFPLFTTKFKNTNFPSLLAFVAEDYNTAVLEEEQEEETTSEWENQNQYSDGAPEEEAQLWEGEEEVEDDARELQGYEKYSKPPSEDAKLYVGNLHYDIDSQTLGDLFLQAGGVEHAEVKYDRGTNQSRGFGFVTMSSVQEAENAVETFHKYELNGRLLTVNTASPRGTRPEPVSEAANRIYVGNLPWDVNDTRLEQVFSAHGKVLNARVVLDRVTSRSQGFGFVTMSTESELNDAIANLDGQSLNGRAIRVSVANERPRLY